MASVEFTENTNSILDEEIMDNEYIHYINQNLKDGNNFYNSESSIKEEISSFTLSEINSDFNINPLFSSKNNFTSFYQY